jgi:hypothetical protein
MTGAYDRRPDWAQRDQAGLRAPRRTRFAGPPFVAAVHTAKVIREIEFRSGENGNGGK